MEGRRPALGPRQRTAGLRRVSDTHTLYREVQRAYSLPRQGEAKEGPRVQEEAQGAEAVAVRVDGAVRAEPQRFGGFHMTRARQTSYITVTVAYRMMREVNGLASFDAYAAAP